MVEPEFKPVSWLKIQEWYHFPTETCVHYPCPIHNILTLNEQWNNPRTFFILSNLLLFLVLSLFISKIKSLGCMIFIVHSNAKRQWVCDFHVRYTCHLFTCFSHPAPLAALVQVLCRFSLLYIATKCGNFPKALTYALLSSRTVFYL